MFRYLILTAFLLPVLSFSKESPYNKQELERVFAPYSTNELERLFIFSATEKMAYGKCLDILDSYGDERDIIELKEESGRFLPHLRSEIHRRGGFSSQ